MGRGGRRRRYHSGNCSMIQKVSHWFDVPHVTAPMIELYPQVSDLCKSLRTTSNYFLKNFNLVGTVQSWAVSQSICHREGNTQLIVVCGLDRENVPRSPVHKIVIILLVKSTRIMLLLELTGWYIYQCSSSPQYNFNQGYQQANTDHRDNPD
jgi:hypothetical protein